METGVAQAAGRRHGTCTCARRGRVVRCEAGHQWDYHIGWHKSHTRLSGIHYYLEATPCLSTCVCRRVSASPHSTHTHPAHTCMSAFTLYQWPSGDSSDRRPSAPRRNPSCAVTTQRSRGRQGSIGPAAGRQHPRLRPASCGGQSPECGAKRGVQMQGWEDTLSWHGGGHGVPGAAPKQAYQR